jgi:hypothetical protein
MNRVFKAFQAFYHELVGKTAEMKKAELPKACEAGKGDPSHLQLLALLQHSGRLIDFLKEDITSYSDADIGGAVRKIHADCAECLEQLVTIRPLIDENEGSKITVGAGYDPTLFKLVGNVKEAPFTGIVVHRGWKAHKKSLPKSHSVNGEVIAPAEIEIKG